MNRTAAVALVVLAVSAGASLGSLACSGDDNTTTPPSQDAGADVTLTDAHQPSPDTGTHDTGATDTGSPDAGGDDAGDAGTCTAFDAGSLDDAAVQEGLAAVMQYRCYGCHQMTPADAGITLSGHNTPLPNDAGATVYPPNLTSDPATGLGCWSNDQIVNAMLNGIDDQGVHLCVMPRFGQKGMDGGTAEAIVQFLRSLPHVSNQVPDSVCPVESDAGEDASDAATEDASDGAPE